LVAPGIKRIKGARETIVEQGQLSDLLWSDHEWRSHKRAHLLRMSRILS
jgi:hypothetical protein